MSGTATALAPAFPARAYFETVRKARAIVKIPSEYLELKEPLVGDPDEVEEAFVKANPGLARTGIAVNCDSRRLREVRICLSRNCNFEIAPTSTAGPVGATSWSCRRRAEGDGLPGGGLRGLWCDCVL